MKVLVVLSALVALAAAAPSGELDMLTAFDYDALLNNDEQRKIAFDCLLEKGPCGDLQALKDGVIKVLQNKCAECNPEQKTKYEHVLKMFQDKFPAVYNDIMKKIATKKE